MVVHHHICAISLKNGLTYIIVMLVIVKILISQNAEQVWHKDHSGIELQKFGTIFQMR